MLFAKFLNYMTFLCSPLSLHNCYTSNVPKSEQRKKIDSLKKWEFSLVLCLPSS